MNLELNEFKNLNVNKKNNISKFENLIHNDYNKKKKKMKWRNVSKFLLITPFI